MPPFVKITQDDLAIIHAAHDPVATFSREKLLTIQFTKLINYFQYDVMPEWAGGSHENEHDVQFAQAGLQRFLDATDAAGNPQGPCWLHKKRASDPWGPDNFRLERRACTQLGYPLEPYIAVNGAILTIGQASRILSLDRMRLIELKCALLIDIEVVRFAIKEMLKPRPLWPRIRLKRGGKGRSYRFA